MYNYDGANRLTQATGCGYVIGYNYHGDGRRTHVGKQVVGGGAVYDVSYVHDVTGGLPLVLQESRSGVNVPTETRKYVYGAQGLTYMASSLGNVDVFHTDRLGSVRAPRHGHFQSRTILLLLNRWRCVYAACSPSSSATLPLGLRPPQRAKERS